MGRDASRCNADLMGLYVRTSDHNGHPAYTADDGTGKILQFIPKINRWVIARMGENASDMCSAYTEVVSVEESLYGPPENLLWYMWESDKESFECDMQVFASAAPYRVSLIFNKDSPYTGDYVLGGIFNARAYYRQKDGNFVIHYSARAHKWLLKAEDAGLNKDDPDACIAYADALDDDFFPPIYSTRWYLSDDDNGNYFLCHNLGLVNAPSHLVVVGRKWCLNSDTLGVYTLKGLQNGKPSYVQADGGKYVLRFWPSDERWIMDLREANMDRQCVAFADAFDDRHYPGQELRWQSWDHMRCVFTTENTFHVIEVPVSITVSTVSKHIDLASGIVGTYNIDFVLSKSPVPVYRKGNHVIEYCVKSETWNLLLGDDAGGSKRYSPSIFAYALALGNCALRNSLVWRFWEPANGEYVPDARLTFTVNHTLSHQTPK